MEVLPDHQNIDLDYIPCNDTLTIAWKNVIQEDTVDISHVTIGIGSFRGGSDMGTSNVPGGKHNATLEGLSLPEGQHYQTTLTVFKHSGLSSVTFSDGFWVLLFIYFNSKYDIIIMCSTQLKNDCLSCKLTLV